MGVWDINKARWWDRDAGNPPPGPGTPEGVCREFVDFVGVGDANRVLAVIIPETGDILTTRPLF